MTVSPLIRTHMTALLVFGNKYVSSKFGSEHERFEVGNTKTNYLTAIDDIALNALIANFETHSQLDKSNHTQSIENVAKKFKFNNNRIDIEEEPTL